MRIDEMNQTELWDIYRKFFRGTRKDAASLAGKRPGYVKTATDIALYASNRATYLACDQPMYQDIAEKIYARLPEYAKKLIR